MTEQDVRDGLEVAVADEPPLYLDPDALIATARKQARRRRALVSAGAATTAIAVAAVAVPVALGISHAPGPAATRPAPTSPATVHVDWPPPGVDPKRYPERQLLQRGKEMHSHVAMLFPAVVPGAAAVDVEEFQTDAGDREISLHSFAVYTLAGRTYAVGINVYAPGGFTRSPEDLCARASSGCTVLSTKRGELLAVAATVGGGGDSALKIVSVYEFRPDGSVTYAAGYNYDPTGDTMRPVPAPTPATVDQLTTLATDPALVL